MLNMREEWVATLTASMTHELTYDELLRYRVFPGLMPDIGAHGWTELYYCCAKVAAAFITELEARHGNLQAFMNDYQNSLRYDQGVFDYDAAAVLLDVMSRVGGTNPDYKATATAALRKFTVQP